MVVVVLFEVHGCAHKPLANVSVTGDLELNLNFLLVSDNDLLQCSVNPQFSRAALTAP